MYVPAGVVLATFTFPDASTVIPGSPLVLGSNVKFSNSIKAGLRSIVSLLKTFPTFPYPSQVTL
ncbi:hypothetical protein D3C86_1861570 [compost metagenome]